MRPPILVSLDMLHACPSPLVPYGMAEVSLGLGYIFIMCRMMCLSFRLDLGMSKP